MGVGWRDRPPTSSSSSSSALASGSDATGFSTAFSTAFSTTGSSALALCDETGEERSGEEGKWGERGDQRATLGFERVEWEGREHEEGGTYFLASTTSGTSSAGRLMGEAVSVELILREGGRRGGREGRVREREVLKGVEESGSEGRREGNGVAWGKREFVSGLDVAPTRE